MIEQDWLRRRVFQTEDGHIDAGHAGQHEVRLQRRGSAGKRQIAATVDHHDPHRRQRLAEKLGGDNAAFQLARGRWAKLHAGQIGGKLDVQPQMLFGRLIEHGGCDDGSFLGVAVGEDQHAGPFGGCLHGLDRRGESRAADLLTADRTVQIVSRLAAKNEPRRLFFSNLCHGLLRQHQHGDAGHGDDRSADGPQAHLLAIKKNAER